MKRLLFLQNDPDDGPGLLAPACAEASVELEVLQPWLDVPCPAHLDAWDGLAIGGGGMSVCDLATHPFLQAEIDLVRAAGKAGKPVLGLCLGAQIIASATGGIVHANQAPEIGFQEVRLTSAAAADPLWQTCPGSLRPVHWHHDTFTLPPEAIVLASSGLTPHQAFRVGAHFYGFQFHLEIDLPLFEKMLQSDYSALSEQGVDPGRFIAEAREFLPAMEPVARTVFGRWLKLLG